jgi:hypothetical protein
LHTAQLSAPKQHQIQEPRLVRLAEINFLSVVPDEVQDVLLANPVDVPAVPIMASRTLKVVAR